MNCRHNYQKIGEIKRKLDKRAFYSEYWTIYAVMVCSKCLDRTEIEIGRRKKG
jgi:hypothetical protein